MLHTDAFFAELEKISAKLSQHNKWGLVGGAVGLGHKLITSYANEKKEQALDIRKGLSPEQLAEAKKKRLISHGIKTGLGTIEGAVVGREISKGVENARDWLYRNRPQVPTP